MYSGHGGRGPLLASASGHGGARQQGHGGALTCCGIQKKRSFGIGPLFISETVGRYASYSIVTLELPMWKTLPCEVTAIINLRNSEKSMDSTSS